MTDGQRLWRWVGRRFMAAAMFCFVQSGATFTYMDDGTSVTHLPPEKEQS